MTLFVDCILWTKYIGRDGYGRLNRTTPARPILAHRDAWIQAYGPIPSELEVHHICGTRACVNIDHLALVTRHGHQRLEQMLRTHCRRGHAYAEHGRWHKGKTARYCRECERENARRRAAVR